MSNIAHAIGLLTCASWLSACDVDPANRQSEWISAVRFELTDARTNELIEKGCSASPPTFRASIGQEVKLRVMYEDVQRPDGLTENPCDTRDDQQRRLRKAVLALHCQIEPEPSAAEVVSSDTIPADAPVVGDEATAHGYEYVLKVVGTGRVRQRFSDECETLSKVGTLATIVAP